MTNAIAELVDATVRIESTPEVLARVQRFARDSDASLQDLVAIIETDPGLATEVLRLANSPVHGVRQRIASVLTACVVLGTKTIQELVVQASVMSRFSQAPTAEGLSARALWAHSQETAVVASFLHPFCVESILRDVSEAYTCGLLHDVGKIVLLQQRTGDFAESLRLSRRKRITQDEAERRVFGFCAADVTCRLAEAWNLGPALWTAVQRSWDRAESPRKWATAALIHASSTIAHHRGPAGAGWAHDPVGAESLAGLGIADDLIESVGELLRRATGRG